MFLAAMAVIGPVLPRHFVCHVFVVASSITGCGAAYGHALPFVDAFVTCLALFRAEANPGAAAAAPIFLLPLLPSERQS